MYKNRRLLFIIGAIAMLALAACSSQEASTPTPELVEVAEADQPDQEEAKEGDEDLQSEAVSEEVVEDSVANSVTVEDQVLGAGSTVTISEVTADKRGWLVVHAEAEGGPGPILGFSPVEAGTNRNVVVELEGTGLTETLFAMLHVDSDTENMFDFPGGGDVPAVDSAGNVVTPEFTLTIANRVSVADQDLGGDGTVTADEVVSAGPGWLVIHAQADGKPGPILGIAAVQTGENKDVVVEIDSAAATETVYAMLHLDAGQEGIFEFPDGDDVPALDENGNVVTPPFQITAGLPAALTIELAQSDELGHYLTDAAGMSLYTFAADTPGTTNCYDRCAVAWPPLLVEDGAELAAGQGVQGALDTIQRDDGALQVTYNDWPLYYWINDEKPGDTTGHNVNNVWAIAYPTTHVFLGGNDDLGRFLVGPNGMSLYRFNPDEPGVSSCYDQCAENWPPLLIGEGEMPGGNAGVVGKLGTTERDDGTIQITYEGMPLYYWINDAEPGDATGQGVGEVWYVVPPYTVRVGSTEELGDFLVGPNGMTLYLFTVDEEGASNCYDQCAENWPPLLVQPGEIPVAGDGVTGELAVAERDDGSLQVLYNNMPLYYWINDEVPGDTTGQGVNDVWFVVAP